MGIIAGQGNLPIALATSLRDEGQEPFLLLLEGEADPERYTGFSHEVFKISKVGKFLKALAREKCTRITLAGPIQRPDLKNIIPDFEGVKLLARLTSVLRKGDDALLKVITTYLAEKGFEVVGVHELAENLVFPLGQLGSVVPNDTDRTDILVGRRIVKAVGDLDIGQAAIIRDGYVLAVEAAEGTDGLLQRSAEFKHDCPAGVLVKLSKPQQDLRADMPTVGPNTVTLAAQANLRGIAVEAGKTLVLELSKMINLADDLGLFVVGLDTNEADE